MDTAPTTTEHRLSYALLRSFLGLDFFGHGYARIFTGTYLSGFATGMQKGMASAPLDPTLVLYLGYVIPCVELLLGLLLLVGLFTRWTLYAAFGLMFVLMFGVTMKQDWTAAGQQLFYGFLLAVLIFGRERFDRTWWGIRRA
ncbi:DoxX family membrane protein [Granulicella cerasi]|uniref:DoxX family membrane protein n=1 Tax=Granulicella cerasi TaxID=741063 RepID=A0ABW1Z4B7_9BACT|nr:DoxX family membrane protein [Granulicella cerasi]